MNNMLSNVRSKSPLVHNITNYVTVNDCANIILAAGGAPLMADDLQEVEEIVAISSALYINIGTLNTRTVESMILAGKKANELGLPVILDPVGMGASSLRNQTVERLMETINFAVIKGNMSEIKGLLHKCLNTGGVDVKDEDKVAEDSLESAGQFVKEAAQKLRATLVVSGVIDIISDGQDIAYIKNGATIMSKVTGTGCMLGSLIATYCGANSQSIFEAAYTAVAHMGMSGERAFGRIQQEGKGTGSFRTYLMDEIYLMDEGIMKEGVRIEFSR